MLSNLSAVLGTASMRNLFCSGLSLAVAVIVLEVPLCFYLLLKLTHKFAYISCVISWKGREGPASSFLRALCLAFAMPCNSSSRPV